MADTEQPDYTSLTVQLLSAYVANNIVASEDLAALIQSTRAALIAETAPEPVETVEHVPAVSVRKSIASREHILSLIDGRPYKTLKRHLATHGLTPAEYRERYGLPATYPMVAQAYSEQRRAVAQKLGLGQRGTQARAAAAAAAEAPPVAPAPKVEAAAPKPKASRKQPSVVAAAKPADVPAVEAVKAEAAPKPAAKKPGRKPKAATAAAPTPAVETPAAATPVKAKSPRKKLGIKAGKAETADAAS
ncbi:MucR family transcriptional regulator [Sphingobium cupriresistens]|uniref:MucR family transcriptional regulator n=1 Tax=Sphingobium cupriresistens LL01 TaxID=1420583 RepID=A0A0J7XN99_9SPHN|nr:MucR family transcriptional regulator [Sphingobium cupriresistens]KMS53104.1 MucR family transcriptional regulator [Sphingobium cupriresistens LL01]